MSRLLFYLVICFASTNASKILFYLPSLSKSHVMLALPIAEELAQRGHQLTVVTNQKFGLGGPNYTEIVVDIKALDESVSTVMLSGKAGMTPKFFMQAVGQFQERCMDTLKSAEVQKLMKEGSFDLVFFLNFFFNNYQLGLADHFKAPWVALSPMGNVYVTRSLLGQHSFVSTTPMKMGNFPPKMNFLQRLINLAATTFEIGLAKYLELDERRLYNELWPSNKYRSFDEVKNNCSAMFYNGHWTDNKVIRPTLPNEIEIGGIQISPKPKPLEADVQKFLDEAKDGVIVWTFGSNLPISKIEPDTLKTMFKVLGGLKQKVIMRWDLDDTSMLPKNFLGRKWLAQDSILAHKNVKLFITHGGHGGTMEAMYHQVPIFGVPFFGDQDGNLEKAKEDGWGLGMKIFDITEENFSASLNDLLKNPKYKKKVIELSEKYRSRPMTPVDEATFWVEYILKYHGAPHLTYPGRNLGFFQLYSLDVIGFICLVFYLVWLILKNTVKFVYKKVFGKTEKVLKKKQKTK